MTWDSAIESYRTYLILEKSLSTNSIEAYIADIIKLSRYCIDTYDITSPAGVTYETLKQYLMFINETGITKRTQARTISSFRSFFKFLVYDGQLQNNPPRILESPKISRKLPNILTTEAVEKLLNAVDLDKPEGQRNRAIIEVLYSCGLRVSELTSLKMSNINFRKNFIKIEGKGSKERLIPLSDRAKDEIMRYTTLYRNLLNIAPEADDILFLNRNGKALSRVMVFNIIKQLAILAGINKNISPHTFRHSFATQLVTGGADLRAVQDILGHESILTTEIYTHLDNLFLKETMEKYHPRAKKNKS